MEIISNREEMIFRKDFNNKPTYSIGLSRKKKDGNYENGYMIVNFKEGTDIPDKSKIKIKNAWLSFYLKDKKTIPTIFINDYELISVPKPKEESNPYEDFGESIKTQNEFEQVEIKPEDLPF